MRIDLNINPSNEKNSYRLEAILPTIQYLLHSGASINILSHRGRPRPNAKRFSPRPNAKRFRPEETWANPKGFSQLSLKPFAKILSKKLKTPVAFSPSLEPRKKKEKITLFENLRFDPREETNDENFAKNLASLGDIYVNEAFAVSHRENASVSAITKFLPSFGGLLFEREIASLNHVMNNFRPPLTLILGGIKIKDKSGVIKYFKEKANSVLLGGGLANTFLKARGDDVKNSIVDEVANIRDYLLYDNIILPEDVIFHQNKILDIGPKTINKFEKIILNSNTVIWNGPMGLFEDKRFRKGTDAVWQAIQKLAEANPNSFSLIGGGETTSFLRNAQNYAEKNAESRKKFSVSQREFSVNPRIFISTGGGAMLDYLSGKTLPGIEVLKN